MDVSAPEIISTWTAAMKAHSSQTNARNYVDLQLGRARYHGLRAGVSHAIPLFPNEPVVIDSLTRIFNRRSVSAESSDATSERG